MGLSTKQGPKGNFISSPTGIDTKDVDMAGSVRHDSAGNVYRYVYNLTGATLAVGDVVFFGNGTANTYTGTSPPSAANPDAPAMFCAVFQIGVANSGSDLGYMAGVALAAIPNLNWGWVQTRGYNPTISVDGTGTAIVIGDTLKGVSGANTALHGTAKATAPLFARHIIALAAATTVTTIAGIIQCEL